MTFVVTLPDDYIQHVCVIVEGYDNLAQVRTPAAGAGRVHIYTSTDNRATVHRILTELRATIPLTIEREAEGTFDLGGEWKDDA